MYLVRAAQSNATHWPAASSITTISGSLLPLSRATRVAAWIPAIVARINAEVNKALSSPDMKDRLAKLGGEPMNMSPEQYDAFMRKEHDVLGQLMRDAGAKPQ